MAIQYFDSPFHVTHNENVASKMATEMERSILIMDCIKSSSVEEIEVADRLDVTDSRVSELATSKIK
ncbi:hypothetical protein BK666_16930 [Pseudomonas frederiksbergensis]|uniref:HigA2-like helix-turn-helix domain-containing protein n=1 Tax=Pseudomonas frederiksbergensis TaxID=104087 RepID=A0A423K2F8_9PSED|nr:hypothetical protein [Pseudomonas frederiksbergensis]RON45094.1 hypothetical protein BK666_16930 [Pseudomonas frederiksbergensis]